MSTTKKRHEVTLDNFANLYGCKGLFDICSEDDLISLSMAGSEPFLDWIGWEPTTLCTVKRDFITWVAPAEGAPRMGWIADPCGPRNSVAYGTCSYELDGFGRISRCAPPLDVTQNHLRLCEKQTRKRLNGTTIANEDEFRSLLAMDVMMQDLKSMVFLGNAQTPGQFSGFKTLINTGYTDYKGRRCTSMDSIVIDWAGNGCFIDEANVALGEWSDSGADSPYEIADGTHLMLVIRQVLEHILFRLRNSSLSGRISDDDLVIVANSWIIECLIDCAICYSLCPLKYDYQVMHGREGQDVRDSLMGGMFGQGRIRVGGRWISLVKYDWGTENNIYILTRQVGSTRLIQGEFNDMTSVPNSFSHFMTTDEGKILHWDKQDETCVQRCLEMQPRIDMPVPWSQCVIMDFNCDLVGSLPSPDPLSPNFPEHPLIPAYTLEPYMCSPTGQPLVVGGSIPNPIPQNP